MPSPLPPPPLSPVVGRMWAQVTEYVGASDRKRVGASDRERVGASDGATLNCAKLAETLNPKPYPKPESIAGLARRRNILRVPR